MNIGSIKMMKTADLVFDLKNPRLPEFDLPSNATEFDVIQVLWNAMDVKELVMSIASSGFFSHEPIIVSKESGNNVVIEGNRRLAAVKLLLDPLLARSLKLRIPDISASARKALRAVPTVLGTRKEVWCYLGFKHVNGPAKWSSYAKSQYIADVHRKFGVTLDDIARQIGDTHKTVQRLFRGLMVIEQAEQLDVFHRKDRWRKHFSFSHIYTGLQYPGISTFLSLRPETEATENPVPVSKKLELGELCVWIYGSKKANKSPVVETQNPHLRQLDAVLNNRESIAALRSGESLSYAYQESLPSSTVFEESLLASKRELQKAHSLLSVGYDGSKDLLRIADTVATLAEDLYREMDRKRSPYKVKRITEDS